MEQTSFLTALLNRESREVPIWLIVDFNYPARGNKPPVKLVWYQGGKRPPFPETSHESWPDNGTLFIGEKGKLQSSYGTHRLLPEQDFKDFVPPTPFIPNSIGHHKEWFEACKTGGPTTRNFDYTGALAKAACSATSPIASGKKLSGTRKNCALKTVPKPTNSSNMNTAKAGSFEKSQPQRGDLPRVNLANLQ